MTLRTRLNSHLLYLQHNGKSITESRQIIPLVIGVGGLCKVVFSIIVRVFDDDSVWSANNEAFRLHDGTWAKFPIRTPARRYSWDGETTKLV